MLKQRLITALILAPIVLVCLFALDPIPFAWFIGAVIVLAAWEWANLADYQTQLQRITYAACIGLLVFVSSYLAVLWVLLAAMLWWLTATVLVLSYPASATLWRSRQVKSVIGVLVLVPLWKALVFIRSASLESFPDLSPLWVILYMLLLVWAADVGAYFSGKAWGKRKLAPQVSPGKSWAGAWGGLGTSVFLSLIATALLDGSTVFMLQLIMMSFLAGLISIIGDLTESMFKRSRGIKDSSQLLPGHGGVMDRIDSLVAAVPVFVFLLLAVGWVV